MAASTEGGEMADPGDGRPPGRVGAGRVGAALVNRLLAAGRDVTVYNRTRAKAKPLEAAGASLAASAGELAAADVVFVMVGTSQNLIDAVTGPAGLISGRRAPSVVVDCSTVSVEASAQVRRALAEHGRALLAAPVMREPSGPAARRLAFAVSRPPR